MIPNIVTLESEL